MGRHRPRDARLRPGNLGDAAPARHGLRRGRQRRLPHAPLRGAPGHRPRRPDAVGESAPRRAPGRPGSDRAPAHLHSQGRGRRRRPGRDGQRGRLRGRGQNRHGAKSGARRLYQKTRRVLYRLRSRRRAAPGDGGARGAAGGDPARPPLRGPRLSQHRRGEPAAPGGGARQGRRAAVSGAAPGGERAAHPAEKRARRRGRRGRPGGARLHRAQPPGGGGKSARAQNQSRDARQRLCGQTVARARRRLGQERDADFKPAGLTAMQLSELLQAGEAEETEGNLDRAGAGLAYDSRQVEKDFVFFAVPGARADGHAYIADALERGASAVVVERPIAPSSRAAWIRVPSVRRAMGAYAARFYDYPSRGLRVAGVTGTNGKTTVTYLLESIFRAAGASAGVIGTVNYRYRDSALPAPHTTPESIDLQGLLAEMGRAGVESVAMEVSSHALELERVRGIDFDTAIFTSLTRDHLDFHADMEHYFASKSRLFTDYPPASAKKKKSAVIHGGDPRGRELLQQVAALGLTAVSYGREAEWDVHPEGVESGLGGLSGQIRMGGRAVEFSSPLIGSINLENILGAAAAGVALGGAPPAVPPG